jgi:hypothetical protein
MSGSSDQHSKSVIKNFTNQTFVAGQAPDGGPKANTLHCPSDTDFDGLPNLHCT